MLIIKALGLNYENKSNKSISRALKPKALYAGLTQSQAGGYRPTLPFAQGQRLNSALILKFICLRDKGAHVYAQVKPFCGELYA